MYTLDSETWCGAYLDYCNVRMIQCRVHATIVPYNLNSATSPSYSTRCSQQVGPAKVAAMPRFRPHHRRFPLLNPSECAGFRRS